MNRWSPTTAQGKIVFGRPEDVADILTLNQMVYTEEWQMSRDYILGVMARNPLAWRVYKVGEVVIGYYAFLPLREPGFSLYLDGIMEDAEIVRHVTPCAPGVRCSIVFDSIVVDRQNPLASMAAQRLLMDLRPMVARILRAGTALDEIGCVAVSKEGGRMARLLGLRPTGVIRQTSQTPGVVYRGSYREIVQSKFWSRKYDRVEDSSATTLFHAIPSQIAV